MFRKKDRFDRFTGRARDALSLAADEAAAMEHGYIGTEHLLLGLLAEPGGIANRLLAEAGMTLESGRAAVELVVGRSTRPHIGPRGLTPKAKKSVEHAVAASKELGHNFIGTEHLLLGLARVEDGVAAGILATQGLTLDGLRDRVRTLLAEHGVPQPAPATRDNVVTCRIADEDLAAIDALVEAGARSTRSEAAAWLIHAGIEANAPLLEKVRSTAQEIERLRRELNEAIRDAS